MGSENVGNMIFDFEPLNSTSSGKYPCAVCRTVVGRNSIQCTKCNLWVHKKYSGEKTIKLTPDYTCPRCAGNKDVCPIDGRPFEDAQVGDNTLEAVDRFSYLGDMLSAGVAGASIVKTFHC